MSTLSFENYGMFIYTQRPVIDANTLRKKMDFMIFLFSLCREVSDLQKVETKRRSTRFSCHYVFLTANVVILLHVLYTISKVIEAHPLVLKTLRNRIG